MTPGDVVLSFAETLIRAIGIAASHAYEAPKPLEFGQAGAYWDKIGWRVDVRFSELRLPIKPSSHMDVLKPLLPDRYAPLRDGQENEYASSLHVSCLPFEDDELRRICGNARSDTSWKPNHWWSNFERFAYLACLTPQPDANAILLLWRCMIM